MTDAERLTEAIWTSTKQYALERMAQGGEEPLLPQLPQRICRAMVEEFGPKGDGAIPRLTAAMTLWVAIRDVAETNYE